MTTHGPYSLSFQQRYNYGRASAIEIPVVLRVGDEAVELLAALDTGSTFTVFSRQYAEMLGLSVENGALTSVRTLTGTLNAFAHRAQVEILGIPFECDVPFFESQDLRRNFLGRNWLRLCRVGIVEHDAELYLSPD